MMQPAPRRRGRRRQPKPPKERDWERAAVLETRLAPRQPELISDGGGLPFPPAALNLAPGGLDREDPPVGALIAHLAGRSGAKRASRMPWTRDTAAPPTPASLEGWRMLARSDDEALFGRGIPPELLTVAVRLDARRHTWAFVGSSRARPLRATRDGIRASSWRLDPSTAPEPGETVLRVLVTEQTFSGGQRADGRVLAPDIYLDENQLVLTLFVTPRQGYQAGSPNPETPVRIALPEPVGHRRLIDGALVRFPAQSTPPPAS